EEVLGEALQHPTSLVHADIGCGVQTAGYRDPDDLTVATVDHQRQVATRRQLTFDVVGLGAVQAQGQARGARLEFHRQNAHAHQVGTVDALETFSHDHLDTGQTHALGRPVAGRTLAVVGTGDDDQVLFAVHVGLDGFPHAHDLAFRLDAGQRALLHLAIDHSHLVDQLRVGKGGALRRQVIAAVGRVRVEILFRQAHFRQVFACGPIRQDG